MSIKQGGQAVRFPTSTSCYTHVPAHISRLPSEDPYHGGSVTYARCPDLQSSLSTTNTYSNMVEGRSVQDRLAPQLWSREGTSGHLLPQPLGLTPSELGLPQPRPPGSGYRPPGSVVEVQCNEPCSQPQ